MFTHIKEQISSLKKSEFFKNSAILAGGTGFAQFIPILISPILTRLYSPADFGLLGLFTSFVSVFVVMAAWGYNKGIMLPKTQQEGVNLTFLSILASFISAGFLLIVFIIFNDPVSQLVNNKSIGKWLYLVPLVVFFRAVYDGLSFWLNRNKDYKPIASSKVGVRITSSGGQIGGGILKMGSMGLIGSVALGSAVGTGLLITRTVRKNKDLFKSISLDKMKYLARRYQKFPKFTMPSSLLNSFSLQVPVFILSGFFAETIVGLYVLAHRILSMPIQVLGQSIANVYYQQASTLREEPEKLRDLTFKLFKNLLLIGVLPMGILMAFGDHLFAFVFGEEWFDAGRYAQLLSIWMLFNFSSSPISRLFSVLEKQEKSLIVNALLLIFRIFPLLVGVALFADFPLKVILIYSIMNLIFWVGFNYYLLRQVKVKWFVITKTIIVFFLIPVSLLILIRLVIGI